MAGRPSEEQIFSKAWMYSQMTAFEDIGVIFIVLFFYVGDRPPISLYVCTKDMKMVHFIEAIQRFLCQYHKFFHRCVELRLDPINQTAFRTWGDSDYVWMDYPYRFNFIRLFVSKQHMKKDEMSLGLLNGEGLQFSHKFRGSFSDSMQLSEIDSGNPVPDETDFVVIQVDSK